MKQFTAILFSIMISCFARGQVSLEIEITDIRNNTGYIMLQLLDDNQKIIAKEMKIIKDKKCSFSIIIPKRGKYAVRYFHDENLNGEMETNMFGKPTEGYGFSNNVIEPSGPPPFEKWLFEINENKKIVLKPFY